jgi:predicted MFS family arabinose efflux permease
MNEEVAGRAETAPGFDGHGPGSLPRLQALMARSRASRVLLSGSPAFRILMAGSSISMLGTRISTVAFPMLVLYLYKSPFTTGLVSFAIIVPSVLVYIPAGVIIDRYNPRRVMIVSEISRGVAILSVVVALLWFGARVSIWFLMAAMVAEEVFEIFSVLADRRFMNRVIKRDKMDAGQSSMEARAHAAVLAGRSVGPFLFSVQPFLPFFADALSFTASVASLVLVKRIDEPQSKERIRLAGMVAGIGEGFFWLKNDRRSWVTIMLMAMTTLVAQALILIFLVEAHSRRFTAVEIGIVLAASGVGGAVGSFCSRIVPARVRSHWLPLQMAAWLAAFLLLAFAGGGSVYLSAATMFVMSITGAIGNVEFGTYLARKIADDMIAKVSGISQTIAIGACALGPVVGGYVVERFRVRGAIIALLALVAFMALVSVLMLAAEKREANPISLHGELDLGGKEPDSVNSPRSGPLPAGDRLLCQVEIVDKSRLIDNLSAPGPDHRIPSRRGRTRKSA